MNFKMCFLQDCVPMTFTSPGTYVRVIGSLRNFSVSDSSEFVALRVK